MKSLFYFLLAFFVFLTLNAQTNYWQQEVAYVMDIDVNAKNNQFSGKQTLRYTNNSGDTLKHVFYHLYLNAFQPNSMMDMKSRTIEDPDPRVRDRIFHLKEEEQ